MIKEIKATEKEMQTEILTDFVLTLLLDQLSSNLFPKRPQIIGHKSLEREDEEDVKEEILHDNIV